MTVIGSLPSSQSDIPSVEVLSRVPVAALPLDGRGSMGEALVSYLHAVGIRTRIRTMERAVLPMAWRECTLKGVIVGITGAAGNAAARLAAYVSQEAIYSTGVLLEVAVRTELDG